MLPSSGYFSQLPCPFFASGLCERPHCHFSHEKKGEPPFGLPPIPIEDGADQRSELLQCVDAALRRVQEDIAQVSSYGYVPTPMAPQPPEPQPRRYIPAQSVPQYRPTPLSELRKRRPLPMRAPTQLNQAKTVPKAEPVKPAEPVEPDGKSPENGGSLANGSTEADDEDTDMVQEEVDAIVGLKNRRPGRLDAPSTKLAFTAEAAASASKCIEDETPAEPAEEEKENQEKAGIAEEVTNGDTEQPPKKKELCEQNLSGASADKGHSSRKHSSSKHSSSKSSSNKTSSSKHSSSKHSSKEASSKESSSKHSSAKKSSKGTSKESSSKGSYKESSKESSKEHSSKGSLKDFSAKDSLSKDTSSNDSPPEECPCERLAEDSSAKESSSDEPSSKVSSSKGSSKESPSKDSKGSSPKDSAEDSLPKETSKPPSKESSTKHASSKHSSSKHSSSRHSSSKQSPSRHSSSKHSSNHSSSKRPSSNHSSSKHSSSNHPSSKNSSSNHSSSKHSSSKHSSSNHSSSKHSSSRHSSSKHSSAKHSSSKHASEVSSSSRSSKKTSSERSSSEKKKEAGSEASHHRSTKRSSHRRNSNSSVHRKEAKAEEANGRGAKRTASESEASSDGSSSQGRALDGSKKSNGQKGEVGMEAPSFELEWELDSEDEEEEDPVAECLRIFNEAAQPSVAPVMPTQERAQLKRAAESTVEPAVPAKKRVAHNPELARRPAAAPRGLLAHVSAAQAMHNRFAQLQQRYQSGLGRVAPVANAPLLAAARRSALAQLPQGTKTGAHVVASQPKGQPRVAHVPAVVLSKRPTIPAEYGSRVPTVVRQRYLDLFLNECAKCCSNEDEAIQKALSEEKQTYDRSSSKTVYLNVAVTTLRRLRREAQEGGVSSADTVSAGPSTVSTPSPSPTPAPPGNRVVSHEMLLQGARAARTSFSIEKNRYRKPPQELTAPRFYELLDAYRLSTEQLVEYNYPRQHPTERGRALFGGTDSRQYSKPNDSVLRCCRCGATFSLTEDGDYTRPEECVHHWGRLWKKRIAGALESRYSCCEGDGESDGCCVAKGHVHEGLEPSQLTGFVSTLAKSPPPGGGTPGVYALDCEMCYTSEGVELTRVTVVGWDLQPVYEALVKPKGQILDYNTRFSGLTEEDMVGVQTSLRDVQAVLLALFSTETLLLGHSLDSDLRALRLVHGHVVDTAAVFPHRRGLPYKRALRTLMAEHLNKLIQNGVDGHDSQEDAAACMELMLWRVREDLKKGLR